MDFMTATNIRQLRKDIERARRKVLAFVRRNGLCENLGDKEVMELRDKYNVYEKEVGDSIAAFSYWCSTFGLNALKSN